MKYDRRDFIKFLGYGGAVLTNGALLSALAGCESRIPAGIAPSFKDELILSPGLKYSFLATWGDAINDKEVFGYNNDYIDILPLSADDLIMWVNHEYIHPLFVSGMPRTKENIQKEMGLVGGSLLRVKKVSGKWTFIPNDKYNRGVRGDTAIPFARGVEVAGSKSALGTLANCAGGKTPWNTFLTCEENYQLFYGERLADGSISKSMFQWQDHYSNPPEHYGWVVEVDPKTGSAKKHTNLGRFAHESATCAVAKNKNVVVYTGDDSVNEHLYKFVSDSGENLESGVLYAANIEKGEWLPLDIDLSPSLKKEFKDQLEVMINARKAARTLGATPLDRPEDIEVNPITGDVFVALTNNKSNGNYHGHILKIQESDGDYASKTFASEIFLTGGKKGGFSCPDNMVFDRNGNLWVTTDISGSSLGTEKYRKFGNNGLFVIPANGPRAGEAIQLASAPVDAEFTGPCFSPDQKSLFLSVQHPGERTKDLENPTSVWPTGKIPKPAVVVIEGEDLDFFTS